MAEFFISLSAPEIAGQIAQLLNAHNRLYVQHNIQSVLVQPTKYFVELAGGAVIGCVGLTREQGNLSKLSHACVVPEWRGRGVAKKLMLCAMNNCETDMVYGKIREDNIPSLRMVQSLGFVFVQKLWSKDHYLIVVGNKTPRSLLQTHLTNSPR